MQVHERGFPVDERLSLSLLSLFLLLCVRVSKSQNVLQVPCLCLKMACIFNKHLIIYSEVADELPSFTNLNYIKILCTHHYFPDILIWHAHMNNLKMYMCVFCKPWCQIIQHVIQKCRRLRSVLQVIYFLNLQKKMLYFKTLGNLCGVIICGSNNNCWSSSCKW